MQTVVKVGASVKLPVRLVSSTDGVTPVTGKTGADATVTYCKSDGTTSNYAGTGTMTEITANSFSGTGAYQLTVPAAVTDVAGPLTVAIVVTGARTDLWVLEVETNLASDVYARIGAPVGASISADIAGVQTSATNTYNRIGAPVGASISADVAGVQTTATDTYTRIGAPVGASISADIAGVQTSATNTYSRIGAPAGASVSADIAALQTDVNTTNQVLTGKWAIDPTTCTLTFYDSDDSTPLYEYTLYDRNGDLTAGPDVYERRPV